MAFSKVQLSPADHQFSISNSSQIILALPLVALAFAVPTAVESKPKALETRQGGAGSVVTNSAGLAWYDSNFNDGNSGYSDTEYYYCFYGGASDFPP